MLPCSKDRPRPFMSYGHQCRGPEPSSNKKSHTDYQEGCARPRLGQRPLISTLRPSGGGGGRLPGQGKAGVVGGLVLRMDYIVTLKEILNWQVETHFCYQWNGNLRERLCQL